MPTHTIQALSGRAPISIIDVLFNAGGTSTVRGYPALAPLRLDFAYPFSDAYSRGGLRVHFSIGQMF